MEEEINEVVTKRGKHLVFCNLEKFLCDMFNVTSKDDLDGIIKDQTSDEYIVHCPFCKKEGHTKHRLYIKKDLSKGFCFVCGRAYINVTDDLDIEMPDLGTLSSFGYYENFNPVKLTDQEWSLDKFDYEFDDDSDIGKEYLKSRHKYMPELACALGFKYWNDNIVMPFRLNNGEVFYYQIRFSNKNNKIRYFFPPISKKPPYIIYRDSRTFVFCEGIYDACAILLSSTVPVVPIACMGSSLSQYQLDFIRDQLNPPEKIYIMMDEYSISEKIKNTLKTVFDYCPIKIISTNGPDPEELFKKHISIGDEFGWLDKKLT